MTDSSKPSPLSRTQVADLYFLDHRAKIIDIAAFLDRYDRADADTGDVDFRMVACRKAIELLLDGQGNRAARVLDLMSDPGTEPIDQAGMKGACGTQPPADA